MERGQAIEFFGEEEIDPQSKHQSKPFFFREANTTSLYEEEVEANQVSETFLWEVTCQWQQSWRAIFVKGFAQGLIFFEVFGRKVNG